MGVSGSGKSTVGKALEARLGWDFFDADDFHPAENIAKMSAGIPLDDVDRVPWLASLHALISNRLKENRHAVLSCSALKERYRQMLLAGNQGVLVVYLKGEYDLIWGRMKDRPGHYMKPDMLKSQFEALEEPVNGLVVDASLPVDEIVEEVLAHVAIMDDV
jgi:gluconokinase